MTPLTITGDPRAVALAANQADATEGRFVVRFGSTEGPHDVAWLDGSPSGIPAEGSRVIAQAGDGLWRRAPWPASDDLFDLPPPAARTILIVGESELWGEVRSALSGRDEEIRCERALERGHLEEVAVVVFAARPQEPLPAAAFAVLAAGRVLVVRSPRPNFGLLPGVDHMSAETLAGLGELAGSAAAHWGVFASMRAFGRLAAERQRASTVFARLAADLAYESGL